MNTLSKWFVAGMISAAAVLPAMKLNAQSSPTPAIIMSMAPIEEQLKDIGYGAEASGFGQMSFLIKMQLEQFLRGLDKSKPGGVILFFEEGNEEPSSLGFVPLSNGDDFLDMISPYVEIDEQDGYTVLTPDNGPELLMKEVGGYGFISDREEMFDLIPKDPSALVGDLPKRYNFGAKIKVQAIPQSMRATWMDMIEEGYKDSLEELGQSSDQQEESFESQMETIRNLLNETDELVVGMAADEEAESIYFDFEMIGLDGSKLAKDSLLQKNIEPSKFAGFLMEGAAFNANFFAKLNEADNEQYMSMIANSRDAMIKELTDSDLTDKQLDVTESALDDILDALKETIVEGRMDGGGVVMTDERLEFAMGVQVADGAKIERAVKDMVAEFGNDERITDFVEFNLDSGRMGNLRLHEIIVNLEAANEEAIQVFGGESFTIMLAVGDKAVYASGSSQDPKTLLGKAMNGTPSDKARKNVAGQYNLYLAPILRMAATIQDEEVIELMADTLKESGRDRVSATTEWVKNGARVRVEIQDGLLELIGVATENLGPLMGGGADF